MVFLVLRRHLFVTGEWSGLTTHGGQVAGVTSGEPAERQEVNYDLLLVTHPSASWERSGIFRCTSEVMFHW